jgi:hypothetical protein
LCSKWKNDWEQLHIKTLKKLFFHGWGLHARVRFQFRALSFGQKHKIWLLTWGILTLSAVLVGSANSKSAMVSSKNVCRESADVDEEVWKGGQSNLNAS